QTGCIFSRRVAKGCPFPRNFETALGAIARLGNASADAQATDFPVMRTGGAPATLTATPRPCKNPHHAYRCRHLARALCNGVTTRAYATGRHVTVNTVYSHLK